MALEPYKEKAWLYEYYCKRRMGLLAIQKMLKDKYNIKVSHQTIFNYIQKYDLDIIRKGKRRTISSNLGKHKIKKKPSPFHEQQKKQRAVMNQRRKVRK
jgi:transposase-like protein